MYFIRIVVVAILTFFVAETLGANEIYEKCKDDPHATRGCSGHCHRKCSDYELADEPWLCPHICIPGCACAPSYVYDSYRKKCVEPDHCSPEGREGKV